MPPHPSDRDRRCRESSASYSPQDVKDNVTSLQNQQDPSFITAASSPSSLPLTPLGHSLSLYRESCVLARTEIKWGGYTYFIRLDRKGSFHTYPDVGGPYQSLEETQMAIDRHLEERTHPKMKQDDVSSFDMLIRRCLYWPDGTSMRRSKSRGLESGRDEMRRLVLALLDEYNDVNYLVEDLAYELKEVLNYQSICEECSWYYHLNFIITSKAEDDREVFVEVKYVKQRALLKMFVCCFCFIDPNDKGQRCNGCAIIGNADMKHPDNSVELAAGHSDPHHQCCELVKRESDSEDEDTFLKTREAELRRMYKVLSCAVLWTCGIPFRALKFQVVGEANKKIQWNTGSLTIRQPMRHGWPQFQDPALLFLVANTTQKEKAS